MLTVVVALVAIAVAFVFAFILGVLWLLLIIAMGTWNTLVSLYKFARAGFSAYVEQSDRLEHQVEGVTSRRRLRSVDTEKAS